MDADTLRLILFILGCFVILGIYLWDRYKKTEGGKLKIRLDKKRTPWNREEPDLSSNELNRAMDEEMGELDDVLLNPPDLPEDRPRGKVRSVDRLDRSGMPEERQPQYQPQPAPRPRSRAASGQARTPELILQLFVRAREGAFKGEAIFRAARQAGLRHGEREIFHFQDGGPANGDPLFSVASMVKPGSIPVKGMGEFQTPGLALFTVLPAPKDGMKVFQDMLDVVAILAETLDGEVLDEGHNPLSPKKIEAIRKQIIDHRERVQAITGAV
jgi:cell division protein ZipA